MPDQRLRGMNISPAPGGVCQTPSPHITHTAGGWAILFKSLGKLFDAALGLTPGLTILHIIVQKHEIPRVTELEATSRGIRIPHCMHLVGGAIQHELWEETPRQFSHPLVIDLKLPLFELCHRGNIILGFIGAKQTFGSGGLKRRYDDLLNLCRRDLR